MSRVSSLVPRPVNRTNAAGAIYGTIAAMAVIAGAARYQSDAEVLALTIVTLFVLWLAHVYSETLAHHLAGQGKPNWRAAAQAMAKERTMLEGPGPMLIVLFVGSIGVLDEDFAAELAIWTGIAQLLGWGITYARRLRWSWPRAIVVGLVNASFGLIIVLLEVAVH
jgi:hypothetical protein